MDHSLTFLIQKCDIPNSSLSVYDNCQLPVSLSISASSPKQQRKLDDHTNQFEANGGFYPMNPQLVSPYLMRKQPDNYHASNEETDNESASAVVNNKDAKSSDRGTVDDEFQLSQASKFNRQDDEFETDKHRDSTESPEYMMSHFSPEELHNSSASLIPNYYLVNLPVLISFLIICVFKQNKVI